MRIGIYGGTFNPIHRGHLTAARAAADALGLEKVLLIPDSLPPHKELPAGSATGEDRLAMCRLTAGEVPGMEVLDLELRRSGPSYTSDTLAELHAQYPDDELWLLMGSDMFLSLQEWHEPERILSLAGIAAFHRTRGDETERFAQQKAYLEQIYGARVALLENPDVVEISSTELRAQLAQGRGRSFLTEAVYGYVLRRGLYGAHTDLKHLTPEELRPIALSFLKPKRMPHVLGTEHEAAVLARRYGADVTSARIAALLHDCTKKLSMEEQLALCEQYGIALDELERKNLKLLHAKTGAAIARDLFGVSDEIYWAIYWHTTGKADMTKLEKVIYLADYIEPSRDFPGVEKLRRAVHTDLEHGLLMALEDSIEEMRQRGNPVHPNTVEARDYLLRGKNQ